MVAERTSCERSRSWTNWQSIIVLRADDCLPLVLGGIVEETGAYSVREQALLISAYTLKAGESCLRGGAWWSYLCWSALHRD